jgi:hypothetical protein
MCYSVSYSKHQAQEKEMNESKQDTLEHKMQVLKYMNLVIQDLIERAAVHDNSKLQSPELELLDEAKVKYPLDKIHYGSPEYQASKEFLKPALDHHYAVNRHHPEHFKNGVKDMNLVDLIEMICDWKASTLRQPSGNILKSIEKNADKFEYTNELSQIFVNTAHLFE